MSIKTGRREFGRKAVGGAAVILTGGATVLTPKDADAFVGAFITAMFAITAAITKVTLDATVLNDEWRRRHEVRRADMLWYRDKRRELRMSDREARQDLRHFQREMRIVRRDDPGVLIDSMYSTFDTLHQNRKGQILDPETALGISAVWRNHKRLLIPISGGGYEDQYGDKWKEQIARAQADTEKEAGDFLSAIDREMAKTFGGDYTVGDPLDIDKEVKNFGHFIGFKRA